MNLELQTAYKVLKNVYLDGSYANIELNKLSYEQLPINYGLVTKIVYGVLERDPMRNVELIEYFMTLPMNCFADKNYDRKIIRSYMSDIVPDAIRLDYNHRGRQSADNAYRIQLEWDKYIDLLKEILYCF